MRTRLKFFAGVAAIASFVLVGCQIGNMPPLTAAQTTAVKDSVRQMASSIIFNLSQEGPNAWLRYFTESPEFFMASEGQLVFPDHHSAVSFVHDLSRKVSRIDLTWNGLRIDPLTPKLAVMASSFREVLTDTAGREISESGYFTGVAQQTTAGWRLRNAHWSLTTPDHNSGANK